MSNETLNGWKNIARYLDFSVRTAQRWERVAGLPVHRLRDGKVTVYCVPAELDAWFLRPWSDHDASAVEAAVEVPTHSGAVNVGRVLVRALELALTTLVRLVSG